MRSSRRVPRIRAGKTARSGDVKNSGARQDGRGMPRPYGRSCVFNDVGAWHAKPVLPESERGQCRRGAGILARSADIPVGVSFGHPSVTRLDSMRWQGSPQNADKNVGARQECLRHIGAIYIFSRPLTQAAWRTQGIRRSGSRSSAKAAHPPLAALDACVQPSLTMRMKL